MKLSLRWLALVSVAPLLAPPLLAIDDPAATAAGTADTQISEAPALENGAGNSAPADSSHPYRRIPLRNAFGIKPPPPEPPAVPTVVSNPPVQLPIFVTGFSFLRGVKKVYLVVNRPGAKAPDYVSAREGEEFEGFQVVSIDPKKELVKVLNAGVEATLNPKDNGMKATGAAAMPGNTGIPTPGLPPRGGMTANPGGGPTIVGRGAAGSGVITGGAGPQPGGAPTEIRGRGGVITGGIDPTVPTGLVPSAPSSGYVVPEGGFNNQPAPVPVPRSRPAPPPPPLPGL